MEEYRRSKTTYMGWGETEGDEPPDVPMEPPGHFLEEEFPEIPFIPEEEFDGFEEDLNCDSDEDLEVYSEIRCSADFLHLQ
ncbi:hypothetical protein Y032_0354g3309 [Ancylostoma ceylanicum]|uniref:Uncharacterized protein n=1 Tax=Ancylostoma ceylanicum TaxID=53326 RepID=A0A016RWJ8_9BILA|nr:hypothetical protein Y032_0354g3309 [Ancylostoma ceylanicum]